MRGMVLKDAWHGFGHGFVVKDGWHGFGLFALQKMRGMVFLAWFFFGMVFNVFQANDSGVQASQHVRGFLHQAFWQPIANAE